SLAAVTGSASALEFSIGDDPVKFDNLFTIGGMWREQKIDPTLIGKSSYYKLTHGGAAATTGLCFQRTSGTPTSGPSALPNSQTDARQATNAYAAGQDTGARACTTSSPTGGGTTTVSPANQFYVAQPGSFSPNGDEGDLNFNKGDLVAAAAKLTSD